ncbi:MAG: hypothetical protein Q8J93_09580, partial [Xanthomonadales bacterium]|nr:hypothetical protein [Xanthomonadales bacterium]
AAAVLDNRLLIEGWVERSETHQPGHYNALDGFRCALPILRLSLDLGGLHGSVFARNALTGQGVARDG